MSRRTKNRPRDDFATGKIEKPNLRKQYAGGSVVEEQFNR